MLLSKKKDNNDSNSTVFIFPARTPPLEDNRFFFLFSIRQMISVLDHPRIPSGPESSDGLCGKIQFRSKVLPVLSLESCLGLPYKESVDTQRLIVIREVFSDGTCKLQHVYALCKLSAALRKLQLPFECHPVALPDTILHASFIKGVYQMEKKILLVVNLRRIVEALRISEEEAACGGWNQR